MQTQTTRKNGKPSYTEHEVLNILGKKRDLHINPIKKEIQVLFGPSARKEVGIGSRGKLDFLRKFVGYHIYTVRKFAI